MSEKTANFAAAKAFQQQIMIQITMKKQILLLLWVIMPCYMLAGITSYQFTSASWASKIDATVCDGQTDGWICDMAGSDYSAGRVYADGSLNSQGVAVRTGSSGAGATSVLEFQDIRRITINFCQNSSKGEGVIHVQIGNNDTLQIAVTRPAYSGAGTLNRDSMLYYETPQSGKVKFWVECSENAIYINSITIRSASGSSVFTTDSYQLVTDVAQLQDSDQVIIGVAQDGCDYIMGYFDEWESVNNIHAIPGSYSADRNTVEPDDRAIYTLLKTVLDGQTAYIFQDEIRYEEAYLVASGGKTKNRLAVWNNLVDEGTYGNYGYWDIAIEEGGEAVITNLGNSLAKIIQYNAVNSPTLFACYAERSQTPVCLYRRVEAIGDIAAIVAPMVHFGTSIEPTGSRTIQVNANKLTSDISVSLLHGDIFSLSASMIDRDGDELTISYSAPNAGVYQDTLVLHSDSIETRVPIMLSRIEKMTISQAVAQSDYTTVYLNDVVVTKKYDTYIYIRDTTGSMLIFDQGNGQTGKRYGAEVKSGDVLSSVTGRMRNYFGVPELSPIAAWSVNGNEAVTPEIPLTVIDSADVCRYLLLDSAVIDNSKLTYNGQEYAISNKFNLPSFIENTPSRVTCIVSYDWNIVTLYIVSQELYSTEGIDTIPTRAGGRLIMRGGQLYVITDEGIYTLHGKKINL